MDGLLLFTLFALSPAIAAAVGYAARKGKPKRFNRESFGVTFLTTVVAGGFLMVYAQRMQADVRTRLYLLQVFYFELGAILFGIAGGCLVGLFTYRPNSPTQDPRK